MKKSQNEAARNSGGEPMKKSTARSGSDSGDFNFAKPVKIGLAAKWRGTLTFARTMLRRNFRDRAGLFFTVLYPLIFLFIFGSIFSSSGSVNFNVAVINNSNSAVATQLVGGLKSSGSFKVKTDENLANAKSDLARGNLDAVLELPSNFGATGSACKNTASAQNSGLAASVSAGRTETAQKSTESSSSNSAVESAQTNSEKTCAPAGRLTVLYNPSNSSTGQTVASVLGGMLDEMNAKIQGAAPFTVDLQKSDDKGLSDFDYIFAGMLALAALTMAVIGLAQQLPADKKSGALRRVAATPFRSWQVVIGSVLAYAAVSLVSVALVLICGVVFFHFQMAGAWPNLIIFAILGVLVMSGIGAAIAGWARTQQQAQPLAMIAAFAMMFLSGMFWPSYIMPEWLQHIAAWLPATPLNDGLRFITAQGMNLWQIWPQIAELVGWGAVFYFIAFRAFRWE
ncbi:MAG: ABC transporter permease [Candidatus Nomurabacteria bacterium]|jgi:ABC-2 type transport system permease protein|nr:ABC transporter permease [Candidatus Nomurabacteria bacterium]